MRSTGDGLSVCGLIDNAERAEQRLGSAPAGPFRVRSGPPDPVPSSFNAPPPPGSLPGARDAAAQTRHPTGGRAPMLAGALSTPPADGVRERIHAWAEAVARRLRELGCDVEAGAFTADGGALRIVVGQAATPGEPFPYIAMSIAEDHVAVGLELPPAGVRAVRARLADPVRSLELATALQALPEQFTIGVGLVGGDRDRSPVSSGSTDHVRAVLDRAEREQCPMSLGWSVARDVALEHAALLDEQLEDAAAALGSVLVILASAIDRGVAPAASPGASHPPPRRERGDRARGEDERSGAKRRSRQRTEARERGGEADAEADGADLDAAAAGPRGPAAPKASAPGAKRQGRRHVPGSAAAWSTPEAALRGRDGRLSPRASQGGRGKPRASAHAVEKGARVRVLEGPFAGKVGVVQELDGRGGARVLLGLLAVRVEVRDLARSGEGRGRPVLSTSHRKPPPVRS